MTSDIIVHKVNDTYCWVECENSIAYSLSDYFTFFVEGYKFMPSYKNKSWDGTIKLFQLRTREIYIGLVDYIADFAARNEYSCSIDKDVKNKSNISLEETEKFMMSLNLQSGGKSITPRDYQISAVHVALKNKRSLINSPTSSGKSSMIYGIVRALSKTIDKKILIVVPTTSLVAQMFGDFEDYSTANRWSTDNNCHTIMASRDKNSEKNTYISTWQSIAKMPKSYFDQFGCIIVDEAHLCVATSLKGILEKATDCPYKIGLTGTLTDTKTNQLVLEGLMGKAHRVVTTKQLMDNKSVASLQINALMLTYTADEKKNMRKVKYQDEVAWLYENDRRLNFTSKLAIMQKRNVLLLFNHKSHGKAIYDRVKAEVGDSRNVYYVTGEMSGDKRNDLRSEVEKDTNAIMICSYATTSTGISIKNLHTVIFASPTKSKIRTLQSIGRGLRINAEKESVVLFDLVDDLSIKSHQNYALKHFMERADYYSKEQFDFSIKRINI